MQRLERALHELAEQDEHLDPREVAAGLELRMMEQAFREDGPDRAVVRRRPITTAVSAAAAALVLIGAVPLVLFLLRSGEPAPADTGPSVITEAPTVPPPASTIPPANETPAPSVTQPPADVPEVPFDPAAEGTPGGTLETSLGSLSMFTLEGVSSQWLEAGFPGPYGSRPDRDFWKIWSDTHSGLEVFETDAGYLGLGSAVDPDEPRIMTGYRDTLVRVRGAETLADVVQWDEERGVTGMEYWSGGRWWTYTDRSTDDYDSYFFAPEEVWFSRDGSEWSQVSASGLGDGVALESQPGSVAYRDGTWMVIGWADVDEPLGYRASVDGSPAAWMSDDLVTWTRVPFDFPSTGTDTQLLQVIGGDRGWMIVGTSRYDGDRPTTDTSLWVSADGLTWEEVRIEDITGLPGCPQWELIRNSEECHLGVRSSFVPGGIALYVDVPYMSANRATWRLWVGEWDG